MRVLVFCPLAPSHPRLYGNVLKTLFELEWDEPYEVLYGVSIGAEDAEADKETKLEQARQIALSGNFDALFVVGYDVQVPADALRRLAAVETDAISGVTVAAQWPHELIQDEQPDCILFRRVALEDDDWLANGADCLNDLRCTRLTLDHGGTMLTPDPEAPDGLRVEYANPERAPATVPYTRTILGRKATA